MSQPAVIKVASILRVPLTKLSGSGFAASNSSCASPSSSSCTLNATIYNMQYDCVCQSAAAIACMSALIIAAGGKDFSDAAI